MCIKTRKKNSHIHLPHWHTSSLKQYKIDGSASSSSSTSWHTIKVDGALPGSWWMNRFDVCVYCRKKERKYKQNNTHIISIFLSQIMRIVVFCGGCDVTFCVYMLIYLLLHAKVILLGSPTFYWCHKFLTAISTSNIN